MNDTMNTSYNIRENAFFGLNRLTDITIGDINITSIAGGAFNGCSALINITLPFVGESRTATGNNSRFGFIFGTTSYTGGTSTNQNGITYFIPTSLTTVTITGGNIASQAFFNCNRLTNIIIGNNVTSIGSQAFHGCGALTNITLPFVGENRITTDNTLFGFIFGTTNYTGGTSTNQNGIIYFIPTSLATVTITGGSIGANAFFGCNRITTISIENNVTSIGQDAFSGWTNTQTIRIQTHLNAPAGWNSNWNRGSNAQVIWGVA